MATTRRNGQNRLSCQKKCYKAYNPKKQHHTHQGVIIIVLAATPSPIDTKVESAAMTSKKVVAYRQDRCKQVNLDIGMASYDAVPPFTIRHLYQFGNNFRVNNP